VAAYVAVTGARGAQGRGDRRPEVARVGYTQDIVGLINVAGGKAVGLTGRDGAMIRARKLKMDDKDDPTKEHDVGHVGEIESIHPGVVKAL